MMKLEVLNTAARGKQFVLKEGFTIGSGEGATVRAQHPSLQPVHARFVSDAGRMNLEVGCPEAHVSVNGKDVLRHQLRHRDELVIGPLRLRVVDESSVSNASLKLDSLLDEIEHGNGGEVYDFAKEDLFYLVSKDPSLRNALNFVIPSKDRFIDQAQVFLGRLVKHLNMDEPQVDAFMTCAKELILNAHRHGHKYDETKKIVLRWRDYGEKVQLTIEDEGPGFDHRGMLEKARQKDAAAAARERYQAGGFGGLGYQLVVRMSETLIYNDKGNVVSFTVLKKAAE
ncbi:MAG: ATP-binding protein [Planctomycetota bacterium]